MRLKFQDTAISVAILCILVGFSFVSYGVLHREGSFDDHNTYYLQE